MKYVYVFISRDHGTFGHTRWFVNDAGDDIKIARRDRRDLASYGCPVGPIIKVPIPPIPKKRKATK